MLTKVYLRSKVSSLRIELARSYPIELADRIISTDEDPSLRIESFAIINLRGVSTKLNKYKFNHAKEQNILVGDTVLVV